jgi:Cd2+/Zn2+-exporting ATPase
MGSGADAAIEAADVVFMRSQAAAIPTSVQIARRTQRTARSIVIFALAIKLVVMILGVLGYASMWAAVFADSGVAALCVAYAIIPLYLKKP